MPLAIGITADHCRRFTCHDLSGAQFYLPPGLGFFLVLFRLDRFGTDRGPHFRAIGDKRVIAQPPRRSQPAIPVLVRLVDEIECVCLALQRGDAFFSSGNKNGIEHH
jgi:hypothetical protein